MIGILTEKPSAKRNFIKALGGERGTFNGEKYVIVNALGHLYELKDPKFQVDKSLQKKYSSWSLNNLPWNYDDFKWEYKVSQGGQKYLKQIKDELKNCDEIVIATDIDPTGEGDLLAAEIIFEQKLDKKKLTRMEFIDESKKSLQEAFKNRRPIPDLRKDLNYQKALFRSKWDFMSMQFTRIASNVSPVKGVIRQGRLKSTMVYLVGEQLKLHEDYKEIPFFQNRFKDENGIIYTSSKEEKYESKNDVPNKYKESDVVVDSKTIKKIPPPKLIDLAKLASMLAPKGYSSAEVQDTYQKMYQEGYLSYPRTEDKNITYEQFKEMLPLVDEIAKLVNVDISKLTHRKPRPTHVKNSGSHGANRPGTRVPKDLKELSRFGRSAIPIYTLLAKNFLAMFGEDYEYEHQKGHIKDYPQFKGTANIPKHLGWKEIFSDDEEDENEKKLGLGKRGKPFVHKGFPPKPAAPTQGWLMKQLEKYNVGSGATRNSTFTEIVNPKSKYPLMNSDRGRLSLTIYGIVSHQLLKGTKIGDVGTTEEVLKIMKEIGKGKTELAERELRNVAKLVEHDLRVMKENSKNLKLPEYKKVEKGTMKTADGKEISFKTEWGGYKFTEEEIEKLSKGETITIKGLKNKHGKKYNATGNIQEQTFKGRKFWGFKMIEYHEEGKDPVKFDE